MWNPGEAPVEGYSNFLWVLLLTVPHLLGVPVLGFAKVAGLVFAIATLVGMGSSCAACRGASPPGSSLR